MIPGYRGSLVSEFVLERLLDGVNARDAQAAIGRWSASLRQLGPAASIRAIHESATVPLAALLGIENPGTPTATGPALVGIARTPAGAIVVATAGWGEPLADAHRAAAIGALGTGASWCLLFNGTHVALAEACHVYGHRHATVDIRLAAASAVTAAALDRLARAATAPGISAPTRLHDLSSASRDAAVDVCRALRAGVLAASGLVATALWPGRVVQVDAAFDQALTVVYRVLFLLFAEARGLVPMWHPIYRQSYSIESLRHAAEHRDAPPGMWEALRAIARLAHGGCRVGELRVAPFNGRLFAPSRTPLVDRGRLDDRLARQAIVALTTDAARRPIPYRDLGVEQLGSVYETLLDYEPRPSTPAGGSRGVTLERGSTRRKATGSFYTPRPIADFVVRQALGPLVRGRTADEILALRILDPAMGSGAFLVSACRYLASACEAAMVASGRRHASEFDERERASLRRIVAERCLYGVDVNPTAVQLARLSLWLATLATERPLTFLDHHLSAGNSLVGAWLSSLGVAPVLHVRRRTVDAPSLFDDASFRDAAAEVLPVRFELERTPGETVAQVRAKERALETLGRPGTSLWRWKQLADAWCAPWFVPRDADAIVRAFPAFADLAAGLESTLPATVRGPLAGAVATVAATHRFFHWELEFPEVFFSPDGVRTSGAGFDAVIGNPPWEMLRADDGEAAVRAAARDGVRSLQRFARESGFYASQRGGHANQYQLFVDRAVALTRAGGRIGLVLPSGIAVDTGSAALRDRLMTECDVDRIVGFENQQSIFPVHRSVHFLLVSATRGGPTRAIACRFGERDPSALERLVEDRSDIVVTADLLSRISPRDHVIPELHSPLDVGIVERAAMAFPPLGSASGWGAEFGRELNATDDRPMFHRRAHGLPIVEGKHVTPFHVSLEQVRDRIDRGVARRRLGTTVDRARLCYRDVAGAGNRITLIAALLPPGVVSTHTLFCLRTKLDDDEQQFLCAMFNSLVVNFLVRMRVGTHVTTGLVESLPVPTRADCGASFEEIADLGARLAGGAGGDARARLDAAVARLYQLSADELARVLETFPLIPAEQRRAVRDVYLRTLR